MIDAATNVKQDATQDPAHLALFGSLVHVAVAHRRRQSFVTNYTREVRQKKSRFCAIALVRLCEPVDDMSVDDLVAH